MMTRRSGHLDLESWLTRVEADKLHSFAVGIRQDMDAVATAGLTVPYSSGVIECNFKFKCSKDRCTVEPPSACSASVSSFISGNRRHGIRSRAQDFRPGHGEPGRQLAEALAVPDEITRRNLDCGDDDHISYRVHRRSAGHDPPEGLAIHDFVCLVTEQCP